MREILFRGKTYPKKDGSAFDDTWVFGNLIQNGDKFYIHPKANSFYLNGELSGFLVLHKVIPETVGQFTGLTDKKGKKIFEGDIVKTDKFSEPNKQYIIKYDLLFGAFIGHDRYNSYFVTFDGDSDEFEVIGNIHDNPELMKGD